MRASKWITTIKTKHKERLTCPIDWEAVNEIDDLFLTFALVYNKLKDVQYKYEQLECSYQLALRELRELKNEQK